MLLTYLINYAKRGNKGVTLEKDTKELRALTYNYARTVSENFVSVWLKNACMGKLP